MDEMTLSDWLKALKNPWFATPEKFDEILSLCEGCEKPGEAHLVAAMTVNYMAEIIHLAVTGCSTGAMPTDGPLN